ncbi:hypothetical protein M9434_006524 [Picochlorum sp. BPE23]|nr:hypothetical protein M9434_006524 [Picochlorum sp. BPE23]
MFFFGGGQQHFEAHFRCYPVSFIEKSSAEQGDKIFLPPTALNRLAQLHIEYPMLFRAENSRAGRFTHCGVLEFIADEGSAYLPYWMMQNLGLQEGEVLKLSNASLPKGSYVKLQPHSKDFLDISNPKAVLETTLRGFSCLTVGDTIPIHYNNKVYQIDIIDAKPAEAISVIETDCNVDFAPPLDYVEETTVPMSGVSAAGATSSSVSQQSLGGSAKQEAVEEPPQPRFSAFTGSAKRLDGKPASEAPPLPAQGPSSTTDNAVSGAPPSNGLGRKKSGKLMFKDRLAAKFSSPDAQTSSASQAKKPSSDTDGVDAAEKKKDEEDGFKPFQGKSYRLA